MIRILLAALSALTLIFVGVWVYFLKRTWHSAGQQRSTDNSNGAALLGIGFFANFLDTLGIGSFATTSSLYKLLKAIPDDLIPGTLNVGHALPTVTEALIFIAVIGVDFRVLVSMIAASVLGAWFGAGTVSHWPKRKIQIGLGLALIAAAMLMLASQLRLAPAGGDALTLTGGKFWFAIAANSIFGAFMQLGVGLYAPCMILVSLLGMNPRAAFPIMMGSCAFLMPVGSFQFIRSGRYSPRAALGLTLGGIPGVLLAAFLVKSLPLGAVRWLVGFVVLYTAAMLLRSAAAARRAPKPATAQQA